MAALVCQKQSPAEYFVVALVISAEFFQCYVRNKQIQHSLNNRQESVFQLVFICCFVRKLNLKLLTFFFFHVLSVVKVNAASAEKLVATTGSPVFDCRPAAESAQL